MNIFQSIALNRPKYSKFDLSHERKFSLNMGNLTPILLQEVLPGDKFRINTETMARLAPMLAPVMHRVNIYTHYFFVPNRLIWDEWEDFITGGKTGLEMPVAPYIVADNNNRQLLYHGTLADYFGLPTIKSTDPAISNATYRFSALPFRAYQLIYNEYYRDQNLTDPIDFSKASGAILTGVEMQRLMTIRKRAWEKDYFTSALPWTQRGGDVHLPVEFQYKQISEVYTYNGGDPNDGDLKTVGGMLNDSADVDVRIENLESTSPNTTINDLRKAIKLQEWLERSARGGARYIEQILSHFGVKSSDARLQRPEFLGGGQQPIVISEVLNTTGGLNSSDFAPQGTMAGHGISVGNSNRFSKAFEEHGYVIGIMSILPKTAYQQGIDRMWSREDKFDYYWPEFAHLGEQEIKNQELFVTYNSGTSPNPESTFGYQQRYAEYKFKNSSVHGDFKDTLAYWHMGRIFSSQPALNESFVMSDPTHRVFAVTDPTLHKIYVQLWHQIDALRPMPYHSIPTL